MMPTASTLPVAGEKPTGRTATAGLEVLAAFGSGALLSFAFPGWDVNLLAWVAMVPLWLLLMAPRSTRAYVALSAAFSFGFFGGLNYWLLAMHPLTWISPEITVPLSLAIVTLAWGLLAVVLSASATAFLVAIALIWRELNRQGRLGIAAVILVPTGLWVALELFQAGGTFGYPWGVLALSQYKALPLLQVLGIVGPFPLSGLIVATNAAIAWGMTRRGWKPAAGMAILVGVLSLFGFWWMNRPVTSPAIAVAAVQGNISQTEKWTRGNEFKIADTYFALSDRASGSDLVVWPESAIPIFLSQNPLFQRFATESARRKQYMLTGTFNSQFGKNGRTEYLNATTMFGPDGFNLGFDAKKHLVPFGEYLPWRDTLPAIWASTFGALNMLSVDIAPGGRPRPFSTRFGAVGSNVCFDSIFPDVMRATAREGATIFVLVTNDGWYKHTMALQQHLAHGVLRAVENRRPFIQAANTGATAIVDHTGRIVAMGPTWASTVVKGAIKPVGELTPYTRWGDWLAWLLALIGAIFAARAWKGRKLGE